MRKPVSQAQRRAALAILFVLLAAAGIAEPLSEAAPLLWGWVLVVVALGATTTLVIRQIVAVGREGWILPILFAGFFGIRSFAESVWTHGQPWQIGASAALSVAALSGILAHVAGNLQPAVELIRKNRNRDD